MADNKGLNLDINNSFVAGDVSELKHLPLLYIK